MERFLERHRDEILGTLSGWDRLLFRGSLQSLCYLRGVDTFLSVHRVLYKQFGDFVQGLSEQLKTHMRSIVQKSGRPYVFVGSSNGGKEAKALEIAARDGITRGLVCVI